MTVLRIVLARGKRTVDCEISTDDGKLYCEDIVLLQKHLAVMLEGAEPLPVVAEKARTGDPAEVAARETT